MKLTARQEQVLDVIRRYVADTGYPPTRADIARELGFQSANAAEEHLRAPARQGALEMTYGVQSLLMQQWTILSSQLTPQVRCQR